MPQQRIQNGTEMIRTTLGILRPVRKSGCRSSTCCAISSKWTLSILFKIQQAVIRKIFCSRPMFIKHFVLVLWCRITFYRLHCEFFVHVVYYIYIYIYVCVCVCVCVYIYICVCVYIYIYMCVCVYIYIYIYICVCACVCVCVSYIDLIQEQEKKKNVLRSIERR